MIKKQIRIITGGAILFIVLIIAYFAVLRPMLEKSLITEVELPELLDGEEIGVTNRIMITPKVERADMKNVRVKNKDDNFKVVHHLGNNSYYVEGAELVPINGETIASFFTNVGYLLSMERVAAKDIEDGNEILADVSQFGLYPENPEIYFTVTKTDDTWYKIIIGDKIPTTGGYYVMYEDENGVRPAIYILDTMMEETILSTRYSIMLPIISEPISQNEILYVDNFRFYKGRELLVEVYNAPLPPDSEKLADYQMLYPAPYIVSDKFSSLMSAFLYFAGDRVVYAFGEDDIIAFNTEDGDLSEEASEKLHEYGFDEYTAQISFDFKDRDYYFIFSKPNENGNYYVISMDFYSIVEISPAKLTLEGDLQPFVEWDLLKFVSRPIFDQNINDVESIVIKVPGKEDVIFTLDGTAQELTAKGNGKDLIVNKIGDDDYFRGYYYSILSIDLLDYESDVYEKENDERLLLDMTVTNRDGSVRRFEFYFVEGQTRRSFYRLNGSGDFYVLRDKVLKLMNDTELVLQNLPIAKDAME